ncbi:MAG: anaerobic magnesium-protoporphyrin IX monomethyl ester cyclase [Phenylobacterium sp.]|jgi:anaerobic magnesium-protoporphyrin IX monomethyl ester cyclase
MTDIILSHGFFLDEDEKERQVMRPHPPLGLMYLSAYLKKQGLTVNLFDSTFATRAQLYHLLGEKAAPLLGLYTNLMTRPSVLAIIKQAKKQGMTVILGGPESANYIDEYLRYGADYIISGEGELTLCELVLALKQQRPVDNISGISFRGNDHALVSNPPATLPKTLDDYPWPDRQAVDIKQYLNAWQQHHGESSVSMITARGCPFKCSWCSHSVFGFTHRRRDPADCADELQHIMATYQPSQVWYADDVFTIHYKWLYSYAAELRKRHLKVPFETISRADRMTKDKVLDTLQEMGCYRVWIGAESGSQRLLDHMQRRVTVEQIYTATKEAQKRGIQVGMFLMWGYGDEQIEDIDETVQQVARINPDIFLTTVAYPIKGTEFYRNNEQAIKVVVQWHEGSDRDLVFSHRRSERYYRFANKYLKSHVEATRLQHTDSKKAKLKAKHARWSRNLLAASAHERHHHAS